MYKDYFRLTDLPFSIAPDPRFLYMSARHREALAHLIFGIKGEGGFVLLTGEIGTGKTTLCRCLLDQIQSQCDVALVLNPRLDVAELLATICEEFRIEIPAAGGSIKRLVDAINAHLLRAHAAGRRAVLIIDEAQNLRPEVLEQLRLLTNLETDTRKLLQIILIGQPELQDMLRRPEMRQVVQRVVARYHLTHLTRSEVSAYVSHRLRISGAMTQLLPESLIAPLYRLTHGVPRLINLVCDRALLGAYTEGKLQVTPRILRQAAREVLGLPAPLRAWQTFSARRVLLPALGASAVLAVGYLALPPYWSVPFGRPTILQSATAAAVHPVAEAVPPNAAMGATSVPAVEPATRPVESPAIQPSPQSDVGTPPMPTQRQAFKELLDIYGIAFDPDGTSDPCGVAAATDLHCLSGNGDLAYLLRFDQPALLVMNGDDTPNYVVLTGREGGSATISAAGRRQRLPLADIARAWSGRFVLLWREPPGYTAPLTPDSHGAAVSWLRRSLSKVSGRRIDGADVVDKDLMQEVKNFQLSEGIVADGVAGALTLIRLSLRLDKTLPRLSAPIAQASHVVHP